MPKVSVVMGVYNGERYLREAIDSILNQTFKDFEFIIINDGSTDGTPKILEDYQNKAKRIKVLNQENLGLTKSLNRAIKLANGEYLARMDADDISLPKRLEKQHAFMEENINIGIIGTWHLERDETGTIYKKICPPTNSDILKKTLIKRNIFCHSSLFIRKSILNKTGLYNETYKYAQDYELLLRAIKFTKLSNIPIPLVIRRNHNRTLTAKKEKRQIFYTILARHESIKSRTYPYSSYIYLIRPIFLLLLPIRVTDFLRNIRARILKNV